MLLKASAFAKLQSCPTYSYALAEPSTTASKMIIDIKKNPACFLYDILTDTFHSL